MFLKRIELFGFKSFADKSTIEFGENISALIGPNGCGKSNVVDAIKWVLGEQSTKTLRADRMEDVIFNGTENRKKVNVSEISLVLSNDKEILALDVPEISIKRRLYRSGESIYYINNTPVKLKELRELFFDTGLGKTSYSIMEQGKIDQILSNKPEDRRTIFEEAAGITKYKMKGYEAERKLEKTQENMVQVENILREVKRSYDNLKNQAEKTETYRNLKDRVFELELDINLLRLRDFLEKRDKKQEQLDNKIEDRDGLKKTIEQLNETLETNLDAVNSMETKLNEAHKKVYQLEMQRSNEENQINLLNEQHKEMARQIEADESREEAIHQKIKGIESQAEAKREYLQKLRERLKEIHNNIEEFRQSIEYTEERIRENDEDITRREKEIGKLDTEQLEKQDQLRELTDRIVSQLDERLKESGYSHQKRRQAEEVIDKVLQSLKISIKGRIDLLEDVSRFENISTSRLKEIWQSGIGALKETETEVGTIDEAFSTFKLNVPTFLDEFLAPEGTITRKREIDQNIETIRSSMAAHRKRIGELREENKNLGVKAVEYRKTLEDLRLNEVQNKTHINNTEEAIENHKKEIEEQRALSEETKRIIQSRKNRLKEIEEQIEEHKKKKQDLREEEEKIRHQLSDLESSISKKNEELVEKEKSLKAKLKSTDKLQQEVERLQMDLTSIKTDVRNLHENFRENHSRELLEFEGRMFEIQASIGELRKSLGEKKENIRNLGHINLMAPEEFAEVKERYEFLNNQLEDLRKAKDDLKRVTQEIRTESTELFLDTYEKVKKNFHMMFRRLFGGGRAELKLLDEENVLNSGVEIYAQPPGKKLESIALLSGGERSLTAVAMLFAVYMVKPSPFCILDEIDAALDEENVGRFVNLLLEFGNNSQFIIITHNKRTIAAAGTLLGVTMSEPGISKIITVRVDAEQEKLINEVV